MEIKPKFGRYTVYASDYCRLDSDVILGGGTDDTENIQSLLDMAKVWGSLHLVVDGACLVRGIKVHSNTTIECINSSCGFYLADHSDCEIIRNADLSEKEIKNENITLSGGTYNLNNLNQSPDCRPEAVFPKRRMCSDINIGMRFFGVKNVIYENLTIRDFKRYALLMGNFEDISFDNIHLDLPHLVKLTNQDGLHFHGPGRNLRITNIYGRGGDDFIALNADEGDGESSIKDVVIDGVCLKDASQCIRLLSYNNGSVENVSIRNISGDIHSYGFFIQRYFAGAGGKFKNISIENVSLYQHDNDYKPYAGPGFFTMDGNIENMSLKNIYFEYTDDDLVLFGYPASCTKRPEKYDAAAPKEGSDPSQNLVENLVIDGLYIKDSTGNTDKDKTMIHFSNTYKNLVMKNISVRSKNPLGALVEFKNADVDKLTLENIELENVGKIYCGNEPKKVVKN